jgi:ribosome-binding factor A
MSQASQGFHRSDRVRKALMREVADILMTEIKDPQLEGWVISVTDVEVSADLSVAKVYISILGEKEEQIEVMTRLLDYTSKIRKAVGHRVRLRHTPEIVLKLDEALERGTRLTQLLDKIAKGEA